MKRTLIALFVLGSVAHAQRARKFDTRKLVAGVDERKVQNAIVKGVNWLHKRDGKWGDHYVAQHKIYGEELVLYTFVKAGVQPSDPVFRKHFEKMLGAKLQRTYQVALQAMILEEVHRVKHQGRLWQCARFLADNQSPDGSWSYGDPVAIADAPAAEPAPKPTKSGGGIFGRRKKKPDPSGNPPVTRRIPIKQMRTGDARGGDASNSQYAALGIRACHDAGIRFPREILVKAREWWVKKQHKPAGTPTGPASRGWCYSAPRWRRVCLGKCSSYGAMTAGAIGALVIYDYALAQSWMRDPAVVSGLNWLNGNFAVDKNPGASTCGPQPAPAERMEKGRFYYLYALERAAMLYGIEKLGRHRWYAEGAANLLVSQNADGSWPKDFIPSDEVWNTCFAILFLKHATRPLIPTVDTTKK